MFLSLSAAREEPQCYYISRSLLSYANEPRRAERDGRFRCEGRPQCCPVRKETKTLDKNQKKNPRAITKTWSMGLYPSFQLESGVKAYYFKCHSFVIFKEASLKACAPHYDAWL